MALYPSALIVQTHRIRTAATQNKTILALTQLKRKKKTNEKTEKEKERTSVASSYISSHCNCHSLCRYVVGLVAA